MVFVFSISVNFIAYFLIIDIILLFVALFGWFKKIYTHEYDE